MVGKCAGEEEQVSSIKYIELSSIRQIAFELCLSLEKYYNAYL